MYPSLDEAILSALKNSTESILKNYSIDLPDPERKIDAFTQFILIGHNDDELDTPGFNFDQRKETYNILIGNKNFDYLSARQELRDVVTAIKKTLYSSGELTDYVEFMKIEKVQTEYGDNFVIKQQWMTVSFLVEENYENNDTTFDSVKMSMEVK